MAQFYNLSSGVSTIFNKTFVHILWSYSWYEYLWSAPWGLEIMAGTERCYVEESVAGRMFNLFYDFAYNKIRGILERSESMVQARDTR